MGRDGPIHWPARSPDLNVLDYFVWGHFKDLIKHRLKDLIKHRRDGNEDEVREAILAAFNAITPKMAARRVILLEKSIFVCENGDGTDLPFCPTCDKPSSRRQNKLLATLYDKKRYVIHYHNLQQCRLR